MVRDNSHDCKRGEKGLRVILELSGLLRLGGDSLGRLVFVNSLDGSILVSGRLLALIEKAFNESLLLVARGSVFELSFTLGEKSLFSDLLDFLKKGIANELFGFLVGNSKGIEVGEITFLSGLTEGSKVAHVKSTGFVTNANLVAGILKDKGSNIKMGHALPFKNKITK